MIEYKDETVKEDLKTLCLTTHPKKESNFINFIFDEEYDNNYGYVFKDDDKCVSCMFSSNHNLFFKNKILKCSFLYGVATHPDYRLRGYMDFLMKQMIDEANNNYLFTFIEAYNPKVYKKYGFEVIGYRKKFSINTSEIRATNTIGVKESHNVVELKEIYHKFSQSFGSYYLRDIDYYEKKVKRSLNNGERIAIYHNKDNEAIGYAIFKESENLVEVKEIVYLNTLALYKLLRYAIGYYSYLSLEVSEGERIEKIFKTSIPRRSDCLMGRVNNINLFNKLFDTNVKNVSEAFKILKKPANINEKY